MTVYIPHYSNKDGVDVSPALIYGEIIAVNQRYVYPDELDGDGMMPQDFQDKIDLCARAFNPLEDFLLLQGDDVQLVALAAALAVAHRWFRALRWDRKELAYIPVLISTDHFSRSST